MTNANKGEGMTDRELGDCIENGIDPNVVSILKKHCSRAETGMKKYKVDTTRKDLSYIDWLVHHQEELMDATIYVERSIRNAELFERMRSALENVETSYCGEVPTALILEVRAILREAECLKKQEKK